MNRAASAFVLKGLYERMFKGEQVTAIVCTYGIPHSLGLSLCVGPSCLTVGSTR